MTSLQCIQCWFIGDRNRNIPPLHSLDSKNVKHLKFGNRVRNKMKCFMRVVEREARAKGVWIERKSKADQKLVMQLWEGIREEFTAKYCKSKRKNELTWSTVYGKMTKEKAFGIGSHEESAV